MAGLDITGIGATALTEYAMQESKNASTAALQSKIQNTSSQSSDDELWAACKSFESYFLEQIFKEMQKSVDSMKPDEGDRSTSTLVDYFKDQTLQDVCATSVEMQSNGFAAMLYENLKRTYNIPDQAATEAAAEEAATANTAENVSSEK